MEPARREDLSTELHCSVAHTCHLSGGQVLVGEGSSLGSLESLKEFLPCHLSIVGGDFQKILWGHCKGHFKVCGSKPVPQDLQIFIAAFKV